MERGGRAGRERAVSGGQRGRGVTAEGEGTEAQVQ